MENIAIPLCNVLCYRPTCLETNLQNTYNTFEAFVWIWLDVNLNITILVKINVKVFQVVKDYLMKSFFFFDDLGGNLEEIIQSLMVRRRV